MVATSAFLQDKPQFVTSLDTQQMIAVKQFPKLLEMMSDFSPLKSVFFYDHLGDEQHLQKTVQELIPLCHAKNCASFIKQDSRLVGRLQADGLHIEADQTLLKRLLLEKKPYAVGYGLIKDKHQAMEIGEMGVDYLFFGKLGYDLCEKQFNKNYKLAYWWAQIMQIPAILQSGPTFEMVEKALKSPVEFVSLESFFWQQKDLNSGINFLKNLFKS